MSYQVPPGITLLKFTPENLKRHQRVGYEGLVTIRGKPLNPNHLYFVCGMGVYLCQTTLPREVSKLNKNDAMVEGFTGAGELIKEIRRIYGTQETVYQSVLMRVEGLQEQAVKAMEGAFHQQYFMDAYLSKFKCSDCAACSRDCHGPICLCHGHYMDTADKPACIDFFQ